MNCNNSHQEAIAALMFGIEFDDLANVENNWKHTTTVTTSATMAIAT